MRKKGLAVFVLSGLLGVLVSASVWGGDEEEIRDALRIVRDRFNVRDWESLVGKIEEMRESLPIAPVEESGTDSVIFSGGVEAGQEGSVGIPDGLGLVHPDSVQALEPLGGSSGGGLYAAESAAGDTVWVGAQEEVSRTPIARPRRLYGFRSEKIYHDYVTTAEEEYVLEERKGMKRELWEVFEELPPEVGLFFEIQGIEISGARATARVAYFFKAMVDTERSRGDTLLWGSRRSRSNWRSVGNDGN